METRESRQFFEEKGDLVHPPVLTISAIAFDFDFDEPKVLLVKNKKPARNSKEGKPGGVGLPTGQLESKEDMLQALKRETHDESGCSIKKIIGKLFVVNKRIEINDQPVPNEIHVFLVEASEPLGRIREVDEIDGSFEPWVPLKQAFEMPRAQDKNGNNKNPNGIYFSHLQRLYRAIDSIIYCPEELIDGEAVKGWLKPNRKHLKDVMANLQRDGLLEEFCSENEIPEEEVPS